MKLSIYTELEKKLGKGKVSKNVVLSPYTTMKIGGPADFFFLAESKNDIINAYAACNKLNINFTIIGGASNVLIGDVGIRGLVVLNKYIEKKIVEKDKSSVIYEISSGYPMSRLVKETIHGGLSGFEYHLGLPGTLGGAIVMNSKWAAHPPIKYVSDTLESAEIISDKDGAEKVARGFFRFSHGYSLLQEQKKTILLTASFRLIRKEKSLLEKKSYEVLAHRTKTQPFGISTSGCFFRNFNNKSVGRIIDNLGLKGLHVGGAYVSGKHANFIENRGGATSRDVLELTKIIKDKVKEKHGYNLREEVEIL